MRTIALNIRDDYYDKFISLLEALPKGAVKTAGAPKSSLSKEVLSRVDGYKNGASAVSTLDDELWDEMDRHIDSFAK